MKKNKIKVLSENIILLKKLEFLDISTNQIVKIPNNFISRCAKLKLDDFKYDEHLIELELNPNPNHIRKQDE